MDDKNHEGRQPSAGFTDFSQRGAARPRVAGSRKVPWWLAIVAVMVVAGLYGGVNWWLARGKKEAPQQSFAPQQIQTTPTPPTRSVVRIEPPKPDPEVKTVKVVDQDAINEAVQKALADAAAKNQQALDALNKSIAELARQLEAEKARNLAEADRLKRLNSDQLVYDNGRDKLAQSDQKTNDAPNFDDDDANRRFLNQVGGQGVEVAKATHNTRTDALVAQGTFIRGILETAVQSDLPGMVRAVTTEDVWSFDGRRVLIPMGSRLIGEYRSGIAQGQTRVFMVWTRVLMTNGTSVALGSPGADSLGRTGVTGDVDNHFLERFGGAILMSMVSGGSQYLANLGRNNSYSSSYDSAVYAREIAAAQSANTMNNMATEALRNSINMKPTVHIDQGTPIIVFVKRDLDFSYFYRDPVKEEAARIQRGGRVRSTPNPTPVTDFSRPAAITKP